MLSLTTKQFLELLKCGLWGSPIDISLFAEDVNWPAIYSIAEKQTVLGICFDAIEQLPKEYQPKVSLLLNWFGQVERISARNDQIDQGINKIVSFYHDNGYKPVLLKGQSIGQYYRNPSHRCPGDIDLFFSDGIKEATELTRQLPGVVFEEETASHIGFKWEGIEIENHHQYVKFVNKKNQKAWEKVTTMIPLISKESFKVDDVEVNILDPQINILYIFLHTMHHMLLEQGVGFRQVCDWLCLWKVCENRIDKEVFIETIDILPIRRCMTALTWIAENYLGVPSDLIPLNTHTPQAQKDGGMMLNDILETGNFGHSTEIMKGFKRNQHIHNLRSYYLAAKRMAKIRRLCPSEVNVYPWRWLISKIRVH